MSSQEATRLLVSVLKERGIHLGHDDVAWAFDSAQTRDAAHIWLAQNIHNDTLLSRDEVELHDWLQKTGRLPDLSEKPIKPVLDPDVRHAIRALESSTAGIEKQTRLLEAQKEALLSLRTQRQQATKAAEDAKNQVRGQRLHESSRLGFTIEEVEQELKDKLEVTNQEVGQGIISLFNGTEEHLHAHDRVLEALAKLAPRTRGPSLSAAKPSEIDAYCRKLADFRTREVQARFDLLLQEQLLECAEQASPNGTNGHAPHTIAEVRDLENEIQTLKDEIASVIEVVVASEVRQPLLKAMRSAARQGRDEQGLWSEYIFSTLKHMIAQTQVIQEHATDLSDFASALAELQAAYEQTYALQERTSTADTSKPSEELVRRQRPPITPTSSNFNVLSGTSTAAANKPKDLSMSQILSRFDIAVQDGPSTASNGAVDAHLSRSTSAALAKLSAQYEHALQSDLAALAASLGERDRELSLLTDALFAFSPSVDIRLVRKDTEHKVDELDDAIKQVAAIYADAEARSRTALSGQGVTRLMQKHSS